MPKQEEYGTIKELKALLWNHLEKICREEPQCIPDLESSDDTSSEIVNIYFGMTDYYKIKILLAIYKDLKQVVKEEAKAKKDKSNKRKKKYHKAIERINKRIDEKV